MTKLLLTPYNALEKQLIVYFQTEHTPIQLTLSFGKEKKTNIAISMNKLHELRDYHPIQHREKSFYYLRSLFKFEPSPEHYTFRFALHTPRLYTIRMWDIGLTIALWRQPKLFTTRKIPMRHAPIHIGGMGILKLNYNHHHKLTSFLELGYKTSGFTLEYPIKSTAIVRAGMQWVV